MDRQINLIDFKIAINILSDYIHEKDIELIRIQQLFATEYLNQKQTTFYEWLMKTSKDTISKIQLAYDGTKSIFHDIKMDFTYAFFSKCFNTLEQTIRYLIQALNERINKSIDCKYRPAVEQTIFTSVIGVTEQASKDQSQQVCGNEQIQKAKRSINKNLQSIDYYLNLIAYDDTKVYEQYKYQCEKLLLQRQNLENIKASDASKEIYQTANMIENTLQSTQKLFQQSYHLKYMEFKSFLSTIQEPDELINIFKTDMTALAKDKFLETIVKMINKHIVNERNIEKNKEKKEQATMSTQTDEIKNKFQDKWQSLLMTQKKNNEKLLQQIQKLKRNSGNSGVERFSEIQKKFEKEEALRKQYQNKYSILEGLYNEKCYEITRLTTRQKKIFKTEVIQKNQTSASTQTISEMRKAKNFTESGSQTDSDFYYYYLQKNKIQEMQQKIDELQKIIHHKQYLIKELEAVKTFRDKFKSKKEICSIVLKPNTRTPIAKSLHYLQEDGQNGPEVYDNKGSIKMNSIQAHSLKKEVTFKKFNNKIEETEKIIGRRKQLKKKTEGPRYRPYLTFNSRIDDSDSQREFITSKSQFEHPHQISLKSILKIGSSAIKCQQSVQTQEENKDIVHDISEVVQNFKCKLLTKDEVKQKTQSKGSSSNSKVNSVEKYGIPTQSQKNALQYNFFTANKSNLMEQKKSQPKIELQNILPSLYRKSQTISPITRRSEFTKNKNFFKTARAFQKVQTQPKQVLHVNNTLNFNFNCFAPVNSNIIKKPPKEGEKVGLKSDLARVKKLKR